MKGQKGYLLVATAPRHLSLSALLRKLGLQLKRWYELVEQRRADVMQESERPFWDDPLAQTLKNHQQGR